MTPPTLRTDRLVLRPFTLDDVEPYRAVLDAEPVRRALHRPGPVSMMDAWSELAMWRGQWDLQGTGQWAVTRAEDGLLLGRAGLHRPPRPDWPGTEVGWVLHPDHWGQGYATEAGAAAVDHGFDELGEDELFSVILPENAASQAVARRLGFTLVEERIVSHFPDLPHGIWRLSRRNRGTGWDRGTG